MQEKVLFYKKIKRKKGEKKTENEVDLERQIEGNGSKCKS